MAVFVWKMVSGRCPIIGCERWSEDLRQHVEEQHLPSGFYTAQPWQVARALRPLRNALTPEGTLRQLLALCDDEARLLQIRMDPLDIPFFLRMAHFFQDDSTPSSWDFRSPTCVSQLCHWQMLMMLLELASPEARKAFKRQNFITDGAAVPDDQYTSPASSFTGRQPSRDMANIDYQHQRSPVAAPTTTLHHRTATDNGSHHRRSADTGTVQHLPRSVHQSSNSHHGQKRPTNTSSHHQQTARPNHNSDANYSHQQRSTVDNSGNHHNQRSAGSNSKDQRSAGGNIRYQRKADNTRDQRSSLNSANIHSLSASSRSAQYPSSSQARKRPAKFERERADLEKRQRNETTYHNPQNSHFSSAPRAPSPRRQRSPVPPPLPRVEKQRVPDKRPRQSPKKRPSEGRSYQNQPSSPIDLNRTQPPALRQPEAFVFDALFHLDRLDCEVNYQRKKLGLNTDTANQSKTLSAIITRACERGGGDGGQSSLCGAVATFSDVNGHQRLVEAWREERAKGHRSKLLDDLAADHRLHLAIGLQPKLCGMLEERDVASRVDSIKTLLGLPRVVAIGEVGLDYCTQVGSQSTQRRVLEQLLLSLASDLPSKVLILYLRDNTETEIPTVHRDALDILSKLVSQRYMSEDQRIQLHLFRGSATLVRYWLHRFPNTFFAISGLLETFTMAEREGLQAVPHNRLLLETNAPHIPLSRLEHSRPYSCPPDTYHIAGLVAQVLNETVEDVVRATSTNALRLFGLKH